MTRLRPLLVLSLGFFACQNGSDGDNPFDAGGGSGSSGVMPGGTAGGTSQGEGGGTSEGTRAADEDSGGGIKLDVANGGDIPPSCGAGEGCSAGCTAVDLLFVIDNSGSMGDYQEALGLAFPAFASTLSDALPPDTNIHVGVTSTEMGYSSAGNTSINNGACTFVGDGDQSHEAFYVPPDAMDTGRNGAQGRLYDGGGGQTYFEFISGGDLAGAEAWFSSAANIGEGGSNIEMYAAPVGWAFDPVNDPTNDGFLRDEGAVLVVFFLGDEPDQSPAQVEGTGTGAWVLERVAEAKAGCGGLQCVIAGGFLQENACSADGNLPLDDFLAGMDDAPVVAQLPFFPDPNPADLAQEMNDLLSTTLASVIVETCDEIGPEG